MFPWPKTDNPLEWLLEWLVGLFSRRGTFMGGVVFSLFIAASLLLWDALTYQWLAALSHRSGSAFPH
jgi:hypothetical protein